MHPFFNRTSKPFFEGILSLKPKVYTIIVVYLDGYKKEIQGIQNPWPYLEKVKANPKVLKAYIKT